MGLPLTKLQLIAKELQINPIIITKPSEIPGHWPYKFRLQLQGRLKTHIQLIREENGRVLMYNILKHKENTNNLTREQIQQAINNQPQDDK